MDVFFFYCKNKVITIKANSYADAQSILYHDHYQLFLEIFGGD